MTTFQRSSGLAALALLAGAVVTLSAPAGANELGTAIRPSSFRVHDAAETLRDYCRTTDDGRLVFTAPGGASWELVTSIDDPAIANRGDGAFHPFDVAQVEAALAGVRYPLGRVAAEVFVLPFPRRAGLESAAGPGMILLSPGVREMAAEQQQAEFVHELGHVVQYALMPDTDVQAWARYRALRDIEDDATYSGASIHANRPHEIFAEDFRALFGPAAATSAGTIENAALAYPTQVEGLPQFFFALTDAAPLPGSLTVLGSTSRGTVQLVRQGRPPVTLDLFDVTGRRLVSLRPSFDMSGSTWTWDGRDASGAMVRGAVVFARARDGEGGVARIVRLP